MTDRPLSATTLGNALPIRLTPNETNLLLMLEGYQDGGPPWPITPKGAGFEVSNHQSFAGPVYRFPPSSQSTRWWDPRIVDELVNTEFTIEDIREAGRQLKESKNASAPEPGPATSPSVRGAGTRELAVNVLATVIVTVVTVSATYAVKVGGPVAKRQWQRHASPRIARVKAKLTRRRPSPVAEEEAGTQP